jgi:AbrB family looped-hinge helix DNA binding protein
MMTTKITVDKAGRVVLPKPVREELNLSAGDALTLETSEDRITLRPVREHAGMRKKQGIWVLNINEPVSAADVDRTIREIRLERERSFFGQPVPQKTGKKRIRR